MNKKLIAAAIAATVAAPSAFAGDNVTVYGKVRQEVRSFDNGVTDEIQITNHASRLGFKGSEDLGGGLKAIWKMEFGVGISGGNDGNGNEFSGEGVSGRNAFVGLAGDFGTLVVGRHDTPMKMSTGKLDYFVDTSGDYNSGYAGAFADRRANGTVAYITPTFNGIHAAIALVPGENDAADGIADAYSAALIYSQGGIHASVAIENGDEDIDALGGVGDLDQWRVGLGYDAGDWKVAAVFENQEVDNAFDTDTFMINGQYNFGNNAVRVKYFDTEDTNDGFAIALDHNFSKRTQAYLMYVASDADSGEDTDVFALGLNTKF